MWTCTKNYVETNIVPLLTIPPTTSAYGDRAFLVSAPKLWYFLPEDIKVSPNVSIFKKGSRRIYLQKRLNSSVCVYSALSDYMLMGFGAL